MPPSLSDSERDDALKHERVWRRDVVERALEDATTRVRNTPGEALAATWNDAPKISADSSPQVWLAWFAYAAESLAAFATRGHATEAAIAHGVAKRALANAGVDETRSRLAHLHAKIDADLAVALERMGRPWDAIWLRSRLGHALPDVATWLEGKDPEEFLLGLLEQELAADPESMHHMRLARVRVLYLSGSASEAAAVACTQLAEATTPEQRDEASWELAAASAILDASVAPLALALRTTCIRTPERLLVLTLWARAGSAKTMPRECGKARSLVRFRDRLDERALRAALALERAYETNIDTDERVALVEAVMRELPERPDLRLLVLAALARWCLRTKKPLLAKPLFGRYEALSELMSESRTRDVFAVGLATAPPTDRSHDLLLGSFIGSMASSAVMSVMTGRSEQDALVEYARVLSSYGRVLRGPVAKIGQALSFYGVELPDDVRAALSELQDQAIAPVAPDEIMARIERSVGQPLERVFDEISPAPFAGGSLGQVHAARLRSGAEVAIKVQYPNVRATMARDFRLFELSCPLLSRIDATWDWKAIVDEVRTGMELECDYRREGRWQRHFALRFRDIPSLYVPRVYGELSCDNVLVSERFAGASLAAFATTATPAQRESAARTILHYAVRSTMVDGVFNTDLQPGNFLFDGQRTCLLDYGNVAEWAQSNVAAWRGIQLASIHRDTPELLRQLRALGMIANARFDYSALVDELAHRSLLSLSASGDTVSITQRELQRELALMRTPGLCFPANAAYGFRVYFGLFGMVLRLGVSIPVRRLICEALSIPEP